MMPARDEARWPKRLVNIVCYVVGISSFLYLCFRPDVFSWMAAFALVASVGVWMRGQPCAACGKRPDEAEK